MRIWFKEWKDNRLLRDHEVTDASEETRTHKIFHALEEACNVLDLSKPIWLESTIRDFKRSSKARFYQDSFMDEIEFDYLEIHVLEED
ncbi:MAG: hypothetical protein K6F30_09105 [Lachnospiraceae bacterium]|nr:hypothetical protein [Lachnospiraceae bacterium]